MEKIVVYGGRPLSGKVEVDGGKNAVLPIMAALILNDSGQDIIIEDVPRIKDVMVMCRILKSLGVEIVDNGNDMIFNTSRVSSHKIADELTKEMRSSIFLMGPLLARLGKVILCEPGGCAIGTRPIDLHFKGLETLGAQINESPGKNGKIISVEADKLIGGQVHLDFPSVGATENVMMAAVKAEGETIISNAAKEPEIVDLQNFLNKFGAKIRGAGTDIIRIKGPKSISGGSYRVIPDRIVAGTLMMAAGVTGGDIYLSNVIPHHLVAVISKLREAGLLIYEGDNWIRVIGKELRGVEKIKTQAYPGFPTDLQAPMMALLSLAKGKSTVYEEIFDNRLQHVGELNKMGAKITIKNSWAEIEGVAQLVPGKQVNATDLRAGAALVLAALSIKGKTEIYSPWHIDRGYDKIENKLVSLGAEICRVQAD